MNEGDHAHFKELLIALYLESPESYSEDEHEEEW